MTDLSSPVQLLREGGVAHIVLNRPEQLNAIDQAMAECFADVCATLRQDSAVRAVLLRGAGRSFGAGGDLAAFRAGGAAAVRAIIEPMHNGLRDLVALDAPVVACLHGSVAGGSLSLALGCDLAIAAAGTRFNLAYANVAANCDIGGSWHLPRLVGLRRAMHIALLCETFDANEALTMGLVNRVVPAQELQPQAEALVQRLAQGPTLSYGRIKRLLRSSLDHTLSEHLDHEREAFQASADTHDFGEALNAFFGKRPPQFRGH